ncbi:MAG: hypothetical protein WC878_01110 [Candidatus Paceibacterota bacterium]
MQHQNFQKGIVSLAAVLTIGVFALGLVFNAANGALGEIAKNRNGRLAERTFAAAESENREGVYQFLKSPASYPEGHHVLPAVSMNGADANEITLDVDWPYVEARGRSDNGKTEHKNLRRITVFPEGAAFDYALYSNGDMDITGNADVTGNIAANENLSIENAAASVEGNLYVGENYDPHGNANVEGEVSLETVTPPPSIDTAPYRIEAETSGALFGTPATLENYLKNRTRHAVVYGDFTNPANIQNTNLTGTLITTGDVKLNGGTFTASPDHAALIVGGNLDLAGGVVINGLVLVNGSEVSGTGNATINGSLLSTSGGPLNVTGSIVVNYVPYDWMELTGLNTVSSEPPKLLNWVNE